MPLRYSGQIVKKQVQKVLVLTSMLPENSTYTIQDLEKDDTWTSGQNTLHFL